MGFFGSFLGSDQRSDLKKAKAKADTALATGYNSQQQDYTNAANSFEPYAQAGEAANTFYGNALGLNGDEARTSAQNTITSDPLFTGKLNLDNSTTMAYLNARGSAGGGAAVQAAQNNLYSNYGNWLDRYSNLSSQGLSATGQKAGVITARGDNAYGYGATKADQELGYGNAMAQSRNIGVNNILGAIGAGTGIYNALYNSGVRK